VASETSWQLMPSRRNPVQLGWLAVFLASAFVLVALLGYSPDDPTRLDPGHAEVTNPCGPVGANLAALLLKGLGYGAWSVFLGMVAAVLALAGRRLQFVHEWLLLVAGLVGGCGVLEIAMPDPGDYAAGGLVGTAVVGLLRPWLRDVGTFLVSSGLTLFCLVAVFRISLHLLAVRSVWLGERVLSWGTRALRHLIVSPFQAQHAVRHPRGDVWTDPRSGWPGKELVFRPGAEPAPDRAYHDPQASWDSGPEPLPAGFLETREPAPGRGGPDPWRSRVPSPDRVAHPGRRASPAPKGRRAPSLEDESTPLLPLVDPSDADSVFSTPDLMDRGRRPRSRDGRRRAMVRHVPTPGEVEFDPVLGLFPDIEPRRAGRPRGSTSASPAFDSPLSASPRSVHAPPGRSRAAPPRPGEYGRRIVEVLSGLRIYGRVTKVWEGPVVTTVGFRPERHIDPEVIGQQKGELADALGAEAVRIVAWGGTRDVGIEVPTLPRRPVSLSALLASRPDPARQVPVGLGVDVRGHPVFTDLASMSYLAVVGQAGAGKSVALRAMVSTLLAHPPASGLGLVLMTPESGVFEPFARSEHLVQPVVRRARVAAAVLGQVRHEIDRRRLARTPRGAPPRDRVSRAPGGRSGSARLPRWVVVIDRWNAFDAESSSMGPLVTRIVTDGPAVGVHLVAAMRNPRPLAGRQDSRSAGRLALTMATEDASRSFLGAGGAEALLGQGDALWLSPDGVLSRLHVPDAGVEPPLDWGEPLPPG